MDDPIADPTVELLGRPHAWKFIRRFAARQLAVGAGAHPGTHRRRSTYFFVRMDHVLNRPDRRTVPSII